MIISDLEHLEVVTEGTSIVGGAGKNEHGKVKKVVKVIKLVIEKPEPKKPVNVAKADAEANAIGENTFTQTKTEANVIQGEGSSSLSKSFAKTN